MASATKTAGRPRDRRIDEAVLAATRELLLAEGYAGLSLTAVATRAGTTTPAIYRRWPTKMHLVHEAAFPADLASGESATGDLRADIQAVVGGTAALFSDPVVRAALPGLVGDLHGHPALHQELMERLWATRLDQLQERLDHAADSRLVRADARADHLLGVIGGSALLGVLTPNGQELDDAWVAAITTLVLEGITP
ncbi:TetR/AcrR family transcriptional regulator [Pimelobacter simplex]|uniref:TetR/AcrR family transcriptional regulator n=1 Tax=Nocardioides simplex TaxID=2045 RepID=UPI001EBBDA82|nr:TetR/AcrR family transcriptional regulator [Pimelobacter simplex]